MQGKILDYSTEKESGIISGADGKRYTFRMTEWKSDVAPLSGNIVDFEANGEEAISIYASLQASSGTSGMAIASLVLSIFWIYWIGSILAIIFGHIARAKIKASNGTLSGGGMALAGLIIGYASIVLMVIGILAAVAIPKLAATKNDAKDALVQTSVQACINDLSATYIAKGTLSTGEDSVYCTTGNRDGNALTVQIEGTVISVFGDLESDIYQQTVDVSEL